MARRRTTVQKELTEKYGDMTWEEAVHNHAQFGYRTASPAKSKLFYGYKVHTAALITDIGPLPLGGCVAPANISDMEAAPLLMETSSQMHQDMYGTVAASSGKSYIACAGM